jgi:hypothetical protein
MIFKNSNFVLVSKNNTGKGGLELHQGTTHAYVSLTAVATLPFNRATECSLLGAGQEICYVDAASFATALRPAGTVGSGAFRLVLYDLMKNTEYKKL